MRIIITCALVLTLLFAVPVMAQQYFQATLQGSQVVQPTGSSATGLACFTLDANGMLDYEISYHNISGVETGAHIHGPAPAGVNAGVVFPLPLGSPKIGSLGPLTAIQIGDLQAGLYYVQIHTTVFPGGEIRGQIYSTNNPCTVPTEDSTWGAIKALFE